ncbi:LysR substrate-binding domain-containing protein [Pseudonocardia sp. CA-107938]|uniref:LysR substrate-binding domain-containing protein n=1 Tax=Pseudonocardia sp. CA-107938 TaxID=3240021 RepID=UPI003D8CC7EF
MDVSTRRLRYFVAVAEELQFTRAAARMFVAQQALSKQIRELEEIVGTPLFRRSTRKVELTEAGHQLLPAVREALAVLDAGFETARRAGRGEVGTLRLGFVTGAALELTSPIMAAFVEENPGVHIEMHEAAPPDAAGAIADGSYDVAFVRQPISADDVEFVQLFVEPLVLSISSRHPLAGRRSVSVHEIVDLPMVVSRTSDDAYRSFWTLDAHRDGRPARIVAHTTSHTEQLEVVATGMACAATVAAAARMTPRADLRYVPIDDAPGSPAGVAWRRGATNPLIARFVAVAEQVRDRERGVVELIEHPFGGGA